MTRTPALLRHDSNPILRPEDVPYGATTVCDATVVKTAPERYVMLFHGHQDNDRAVIGQAEGRDGFTFRVTGEPFLAPATAGPFAPYEEYGLEHPRVCRIDDAWWITYVGLSRHGPRGILARSPDLRSVRRVAVFAGHCPDGVALFPARFGGRYARIERPLDEVSPWCLSLRFSDDLADWDDEARLVDLAPEDWNTLELGPGAPPFLSPAGWIDIYGGVSWTLQGALHHLGVALHEREAPEVVLGVADEWLVRPEAPCETCGHVPNVVTCCGALPEDDGTVNIYWGAADSVICAGTVAQDDLVAMCLDGGRPADRSRHRPSGRSSPRPARS